MPRNKENIQKVIDALKAEILGFGMMRWYSSERAIVSFYSDKPSCGTTACIGGHAEHIMSLEGVEGFTNKNSYDYVHYYYPQQVIRKWLGIGLNTATELFFPYGLEFIKREHAIAQLEALRDKKKMDWNKYVPDFNNGDGPAETYERDI